MGIADILDLNPLTVSSDDRLVFAAIYEYLLLTDNEGKITSRILESWTVSDDARTVAFTMKPDIEWTDGTPMTSADIVMSLTQVLDPNISIHAGAIGGVAGQDAFAEGKADSISGITAPDEHTIIVKLDEPNAAWLPNLASYDAGTGLPILPHHILGDVPHGQLAEHEFFKTHPVSSGPYQLVDYVAQQHVELEKNRAWSLGEAGFERIFMRIGEYEARLGQLEAGEIQFMPVIEAWDADRIDAINGVEIQTAPGAGPYLWALMNYEPLLDPKVRQAMVYAIDREGICQQVLSGYCSVPLTNVRQVAPDWSIPTDDMIEYNYDPDRARDLLDEAGWDPNTELVLHLPNSLTEYSNMLEVARTNMADVGINWQIEIVDPSVMFEAIESKGRDIQGAFGGGGNFTVDPSAVQPFTSCDTHFPAGRNSTHYCDSELDKLWDAGLRAVDKSKRAEIYHEAFRRLNRNPAEIYLYVPDKIIAHDSRLKGVEIHPDYYSSLWNIGEWYWED